MDTTKYIEEVAILKAWYEAGDLTKTEYTQEVLELRRKYNIHGGCLG